ncbi:hypothetical protein ACLK19_12760 [Escherichia coli]
MCWKPPVRKASVTLARDFSALVFIGMIIVGDLKSAVRCGGRAR